MYVRLLDVQLSIVNKLQARHTCIILRQKVHLS